MSETLWEVKPIELDVVKWSDELQIFYIAISEDRFKEITTNKQIVPEAIIQDAQVSAGQARYVEAVNDCIRITEESSARFLVPKLEELKAKFLEGIK
jgi:hypothetical protein